jgi:phospholipid/cholesterol/gamma-HCH transport system substrate-binding protein
VSDYETIQRRRNIIVGVFVIVALCGLVWLIFKFGDLPGMVSKMSSFQVYVQFPSAPGVQKDTPVRFCGYQIGAVTSVMAPKPRKDLNTQKEYHQTLVALSIDKRYVDIPSNVDVKLMTRGLGSSYIELKLDPEKLPAPPRDPNRPETCFLVNGMMLQGSTGMTSEFFPEESQKKLDGLITSLASLIDNADDILGDKKNKENLKRTLANLSEATKQATHTLKEFQDFSAAGAATMRSADANIQKLVIAMVDISEQLSRTVAQLRVILDSVSNGQGTAARLLKDGRLYENLIENTQALQGLLEDLRSFIAEVNEKGLRSKW